MKHLLNKKVNKIKEDVQGYGCSYTCFLGCNSSCTDPCTNGCQFSCYGGSVINF